MSSKPFHRILAVAASAALIAGGLSAQGWIAKSKQVGQEKNKPQTPQSSLRPLSSMIAVTLPRNVPQNIDFPTGMFLLIQAYTRDALPGNLQFPLNNASTDTVRVLPGLRHNVVAKWMDPLTNSFDPAAPAFGANCDFIAYFGDGWNSDWLGGVVGSSPMFSGSGRSAWIWSNHEYVSNSQPTTTSAPTGQHLTFARKLREVGILTNNVDSNVWSQADVDTYIDWFKRQIGGTWFRIAQDQNNDWHIVKDNRAKRYDATGETQVAVVGYQLGVMGLDHVDDGTDLPANVVAGIQGDCSGGVTPWGTIISAEENVQGYYGDLETAWSSGGRFLAGNGFDPGSNICPIFESTRSGEFGQHSKVQGRHNRDAYGFMVEMDPGEAPNLYYKSLKDNGNGDGHRKIGGMGRARWENAAIVTNADWKLAPDKPIVIYGGNDRRGGRIFKWVSEDPYKAGMTRAQVRALLDEGYLYVAHFAGLDNTTGLDLLSTKKPPTEAGPGTGQWIHLSTSSTDIAPNAAAIKANTTVGAALKDVNWNGVGGFPDDNAVLSALYTVNNKIGVMELNRPEDIEWNPKDFSGKPRLYVAFTNHGRQVALDQSGKTYDPSQHASNSPLRPDPTGGIFAMEEASPFNPHSSKTFKYWAVWLGTRGTGPFDAANPDNLMIDNYGGVWFGTDGNFGRNQTADALYYLNLIPGTRANDPGVRKPSYGLAFRVAAGPSDCEFTGPALSADQRSIFANIQHPGEGQNSTWPQQR